MGINYRLKFIVSIVVLCGAVISAFLGLSNNSRAKACLSWPQVNGQIVSSELIGQGSELGLCGLDFQYSYEVQGQTYFADRIDFGEPVATFKRDIVLRQIQEKYKPDSSVTVYYDPDNPSNAVLERDVQPGILYYIVAAALICLSGYIFKDAYLDLKYTKAGYYDVPQQDNDNISF